VLVCESGTTIRMELCVDHVFVDAEGYTCADYGDASAEECAKANAIHVTPNQTCCGCGGGEREAHERRKNCRYMLCLTRDN
jgi:hypothetical protein